MSARIMDDAAKALANPQDYTDEVGLHEKLAHLRRHAPVSWVDAPPIPAVLGDHQARRHH